MSDVAKEPEAPALVMDPQTGNMVSANQMTGGLPSSLKNPDHVADLKAHEIHGKRFDENGAFKG